MTGPAYVLLGVRSMRMPYSRPSKSRVVDQHTSRPHFDPHGLLSHGADEVQLGWGDLWPSHHFTSDQRV